MIKEDSIIVITFIFSCGHCHDASVRKEDPFRMLGTIIMDFRLCQFSGLTRSHKTVAQEEAHKDLQTVLTGTGSADKC